jgi:hypothetical protein
MAKVYPHKVGIVTMPSGRHYAYAARADGSHDWAGPWREWDQRDKAIRDLAGWLEDHGYVHPMTHDVAAK